MTNKRKWACMKKWMVIGIVLIIVSGLFYRNLSQSDDMITIGVIGDYSARTSASGIDAYRAIELAVEEINGEVIKYQLERFNLGEYQDDEVLKEALERKGVDVIIGPSSSSEFLKIRHMLQSLKIPIFLNAVSTNEINDLKDNLFRITSSIEIQVDSMWQAAKDYLNVYDIDVFYTASNINYSKPLAEGLVKKLEEHGGVVNLVEIDDLSDDDVQKLLIGMVDSQSVVVIAGPSQAGIIAQMVGQNSPNASFLFPSWAQSNQTLDYVKQLNHDIYMIASPETLEEKSYEALTEIFKSEKNISMSPAAFFGYEVMYFVDYVLNETQSVELEEIQDFIHQIDIYESAYHEYKFNKYGDGARGYSLMKIIDGSYVLVKDLIEWGGYDD